MSVQSEDHSSDEESLFRQEALVAFGRRHYGQPIAFIPRLWSLSAFLVVILTILSLIYAASATYARKERAVGWLMPDQGLVRVSSQQPAQIAHVLVDEGDHVAVGDELVVLSLDSALEGGSFVSKAMLDAISVEERELRQQLVILQSTSEIEATGLKITKANLSEELKRLNAQLKAQDDRISIARDLFERYKELQEHEASSHLEVENQRDQLSSQIQNREALAQRLVVLERERAELNERLELVPFELARALSKQRADLASLAQRRTQLQSQGRIGIRSPINGVIASLNAEAGTSALGQETLLSIVPEGSSLYAQVYIPSRGIGFIEPGQSVRLMYETFPHQRYGSAWGTVESVSWTVLRSDEVPSALNLGEPAYKARIRLDEQHVNAFGRSFPLRPGMALSAEIIQERRSLLQLLLEPLRARQGESQ